jgi:hypothetical protein
VQRLSSDYFLSARFGSSGLVLLAAALLFSKKGSARQALWPVCYVELLLALYSGPYLVLPEDICEQNQSWSAGRLMLQLVPMTLLAVALLALPRHRSPPAAR